MSRRRKAEAHRTLWSLVEVVAVVSADPRKIKIKDVRHFETQPEAERQLAELRKAGGRGYVVPPVSAWGGHQRTE